MSTQELEQVTLDYLKAIYNRPYIGKIRVEKLNPIGYCIRLGMDTPLQPITIYAELEDKAFLQFLKRDLKDRRFNLRYFGELTLTYPYDDKPRNTSCICQKTN